jgi:5-methylcytosine-specific restriction enzyme subunit McrC
MNIPIENIYYLLCYSWNRLEEAEIVDVNAIKSTDILELFAKVLVSGCNHILRRGLDRSYIAIEEDTRRLKGKINFTNSIKRNLIKSAILNCEYDEMSYDILHNQILKTTIYTLLKADIDREIQEDLRGIYHSLNEVSLINLSRKSFRKVQLHSNNFFYDFLLKICEIIHDNIFIDENSGNYKFRDFTRNESLMARLFEEFVRNFYDSHLLTLPRKIRS